MEHLGCAALSRESFLARASEPWSLKLNCPDVVLAAPAGCLSQVRAPVAAPARFVVTVEPGSAAPVVTVESAASPLPLDG